MPTRTPAQRERIEERFRQAETLARSVRSDKDALALVARLRMEADVARAGEWEPYPWQHPHIHPPGWASTRAPGVCDAGCADLLDAPIPTLGTWLQVGGRGTGKSEGAGRYVDAHVRGPACDTRIPGGHLLAMVAPTQGDAVKVLKGPSGVITMNPSAALVGGIGGLELRWRNGARMYVIGASTDEDVDRLRAAGNVCLVWLEEMAAQRRLADVRKIGLFGLRTGPNPHYVASTTPKGRAEVKAVMGDARTVTTRGRTRDAHRLDPELREVYEVTYGGTTLGRQELDGEYLEAVEGALWVPDARETDDEDHRPGIEEHRVDPAIYHPAAMHRVVVALDPSGGGKDEAGIGVLGAIGNIGYVLADLSGHMTPDDWARTAVQAYRGNDAEGIAVETAFGAELVPQALRTVTLDDGFEGWRVPLFRMPTKVGKRLRAEPVVAIAQQQRIKYAGLFPGLESQLTTWVPDETRDSPDRVDMYVHGFTHLLIKAGQAIVRSAVGRPLGPTASVRRQLGRGR